MRPSFTLLLVAAVCTAASPSAVLAQATTAGGPQPLGSVPVNRGLFEAEITLDQATPRGLQLNPARAGGSHAVSIAEARVTQAGLLPNPEFELETENVGGSGAFNGFNAAESTVVISQPIPLGGKRVRRRAVAESEHALARHDLDAIQLDVIADTTSAFYRMLAAQQREAQATELLSLAEQFAHTVQIRVDAGKTSPVEAARAGIEAAHARVRLARADRELEAARVQLAATWGATDPRFDRVVGELPQPSPPPPFEQLRPLLLNAPEIARLLDSRGAYAITRTGLERLIGRSVTPRMESASSGDHPSLGERR